MGAEAADGRSADTAAARVMESDLLGLPEPVVGYLRRVLSAGARPVTSIFLRQQGEILVGDTWRRFSATEQLSANPPRFVWDARISMLPLLNVRVVDAYDQGEGAMRATVARIIPFVSQRGGAELNAGALHRYLAETTWMPAALLPRFGVRWTAIDATRAQATLTDRDTTVSLEFTFNARNEVTRIYTPGRARAVGRRFESTPWTAQFGWYEEHCGMWIPMEGEVSWQLGGVWSPCWRGRLLRVLEGSPAASSFGV